MKHAFGLLFLLPLAHLRAQTITMPGAGSASYSGCAGTVYDPGGTGNYDEDIDAVQVLRPPTGSSTSRVRLTFTSFNLEADYDYLYIYDGPNTSAPLLARLTGTEGLNQTYTATTPSGALTLRFVSDPIISAPGFAATLSCAVVSTAGNVGIGTTEPVEKLHVTGIIYSSQGGVRFPDGSVQTTAGAPADNLGNHTVTQNLDLNGNWLSNSPNNSNGLRIDINGRVGINTATPQQTLDVNGTARAAAYTYPSAQTRYLQLGPGDFVATNPAVSQVQSSTLFPSLPGAGIVQTGSGLGTILAPVHLPQGATVTSLQVTVFDNDGSSAVTQARLVNYFGIVGSNGSGGDIGPWITVPAGTGTVVQGAGAVNMTIDNSTRMYFVEFQGNRHPSLVLLHLRLTYTVSQTD